MPRTTTAIPSAAVTPTTLATRDALIRELAASGGLWPVLPWHPCALCAMPRRRLVASPLCVGCCRARDHYGPALSQLHPAALTARDWTLGHALRTFKDAHHCDPASPYARAFGSVLSAFLTHAIAPDEAALLTAIPSSNPVITSSLTRASHEGWPVPAVHAVAAACDGFPGQRRRPLPQRMRVEGKWLIDAAAVSGSHVVVLDDVATTGATLHSFADALIEAGAVSVRAVVLARMAGPDAHWLLGLLQAGHELGVRWRPDTPRPQVWS